SWVELAEYLEASHVYPSTKNQHWSLTGVASMIKNPVYLGQARSGKVVNENAHEPLVTRAEFDAAQSVTKSLLTPHDGSLASDELLGGFAPGAGCGHALKFPGTPAKRTGERYPVYYCSGRYASGICPARASVRASLLDDYVEARVLEALANEDGVLAAAVAASEQNETPTPAGEEAEHEPQLFGNNPKLLSLPPGQRVID